MSDTRFKRPSSNQLLLRLSQTHYGALDPYLQSLDLPQRFYLEHAHKKIEYVYFVDSGFASVVADGSQRPIEIGLIGHEGMSGMAVLLGAERAAQNIYMQLAGNGHRIAVGDFKRVLSENVDLHHSLLPYVQVFLTQASQTAAANGRLKVEERLARWLLMADDRAGESPMALTHEFLSIMLGIRRAGVTVALNALVQSGLVQLSRGAIKITDRDGLLKLCNGAYGEPEAEYELLFKR